MANLSLSRRSFLKASAMAAAATTVGFAATPSTALAEGEDASAGEIKRIRSCCRACGKVECGVLATSASAQESTTDAKVSWITVAVAPESVQEIVAAAQKTELYFTLPGSEGER